MSEIALGLAILSLVAVVGLWIGNWHFYGVGLGIGGVLFGGIIVGHFAKQYGVSIDLHVLDFIREFGLILFVYTIGIQVGPGFFASLRQSGLKLNLFAAALVVAGGVVAVVLHKTLHIPLPIILGIYSGAVTNTPSLGAGQLMLSGLGVDTDQMILSYAVAYPFGICGILLSMWLIRLIFRVHVAHEATRYSAESGNQNGNLTTMNIAVKNGNLEGLSLDEIPGLEDGGVVCSRLKRDELLMVPKPETIVHLGDLLHLVGNVDSLRKIKLIIGEEVDVSLSTKGTDLRVERVVVTNEKVLGKTIGSLNLKSQYDVVVSRLNRAGIELVPRSSSSLQFGDILNLVGRSESIDAVGDIVGNAQHKLQQVQMLPVFIGIGLGVLVGSLPFYVPGVSAALSLGLAGGPLIVALLLSRLGSIGTLYWFMPPSANQALREIGIVLFLAVVGLKSGGQFVATLIHGDGLLWMGCGAAITLIPLLVVGSVARIFGHINYLSLCGLMAGSMTDPPALAFANGIHPQSDAAALAYATVYPLVMFLRIISPQILILLLWLGG
jgi:putative transport protein